MIAGLILAAGESSRMGRDKALLPFRGRTFLENIIATLHGAGVERIAVVLGHHAAKIRRSVNLSGVEVLVHRHYRQGQTSSLQAGLKTLGQENLEAVVLCLVDHPTVSPETIRKLIAGFRESSAPIVIPTLNGRRGHPVLIGCKLLPELKKLGAGEGANTVMRKHRDRTHFVEVSDPGILADVDDPETYRRLEDTFS